MAYTESCRAITVEAGSAVVAHRFLAIAADGQADHAAVAQGDVDGICGETTTVVGTAIPMIVPDGGVAMVEAGAAISRGALVGCQVTTGKAITWVDAAGNKCMGRAMEAAGADGNIIAIQFLPKKVGAGS